METHTFAAAFGNAKYPDSVMDIFRTQAQAFDKFRKEDDKLMVWLTPIVHILFTFSGALDGIGLVSSRSLYDILPIMSTFLAILARKYSLYWYWRPEDPEDAVLFACSTLISIINDKSSKIVQFSHFSVQEFLTSDRL